MNPPTFMGSELFVAAFRLAGVSAYAAGPEGAGALFDRLAAERPPLLLVGESCVSQVGEAKLRAAIIRAEPPLLLVADLPGRAAPENLAAMIREELGVA